MRPETRAVGPQIQGYGTLKSGLWDTAVGPDSCPASGGMGHFERQCRRQPCVIPGEGLMGVQWFLCLPPKEAPEPC